MPYMVEKEFRFEAAHTLKHHDGKCARLHGHSWVGRVRVVGNRLSVSGPKTGMLMDFGDLSAVLKPLVEGFLDHRFLNETLATDSPTSEIVAKWLFDHLLTVLGANLDSVRIEETCTSAAEYRL